MRKSYIIDSNILIEDHKCIEILKNGEENWIYIPETVIEELDSLKDKKPHLKDRIFSVIAELEKYKDYITIISSPNKKFDSKDNQIIDEIQHNINKINDPVFVTNDKILKLKAYKKGISVEGYKSSVPYKHISELYTGFIDETDEKINNCFFWREGKLYFWSKNEEKLIDYQNSLWKVTPKNHYQNCFFDLIKNENIDCITVQSPPGKGKTFMSLAAALYMTFEKKMYEKVYVVKANYEIGESMGFLPGNVDQKIMPYIKPVQNLIMKLHKNRELPKKLFDPLNEFGLNPRYIEFMPISYLRGLDIENSFVIIEEAQNLSRQDARSVLTRMGEGTKVVLTGDINQIDNPYLDKYNNAMNWIVKLFKNEPNYAHIVLQGKFTRGPVCELASKMGL